MEPLAGTRHAIQHRVVERQSLVRVAAAGRFAQAIRKQNRKASVAARGEAGIGVESGPERMIGEQQGAGGFGGNSRMKFLLLLL